MIVLDASAVVELLLRMPASVALDERVLGSGETLHAPELLDVEVPQVLRRYEANHDLSPPRGAEAVDLLVRLPIIRYPHHPLLPRIWRLRAGLTAYDAAYIALAESLGAPVVTRDRRLARTTGHRARIEFIEP